MTAFTTGRGDYPEGKRRRGRPSQRIFLDLGRGERISDNPTHPLVGLTADQRTDARHQALAAVLAAVARPSGETTGVRKAVGP
jgi:hypothetical protein